MNYGKELILDIHNCSTKHFNRDDLTDFFIKLCDLIDMEREDLHFWDDLNTTEGEKETEAHLIGTSAIQFIRTSNVTIHTLDILKRVYLNIFSCKDFNTEVVISLCVRYFSGNIINKQEVERL